MKKTIIISVFFFASIGFCFSQAQIVTGTSLDLEIVEEKDLKEKENLFNFNFWAIPIAYNDENVGIERDAYTVNFGLSYNRNYIHIKEDKRHAFIGGWGFDAIYKSIGYTSYENGSAEHFTHNCLGGNFRGMIGYRINATKTTSSDLYLSFVAGLDFGTNTNKISIEYDDFDANSGHPTLGVGLGYNLNIEDLVVGAEFFINAARTDAALSGLILKVGYRW